MAAINDDVYARVREKVKEHNLTEQELKAIDTARDQLQTHTYTGGVTGATAAFLIAKSKRFNPIQLLALTGGGFLMGSQMGLISGALAGVKTINNLPNPQRLINVIREVQQVLSRLEAMKGRQGANGSNQSKSGAAPTVRPHAMSPQELHEAQSPQDQFSPDMNENTSGDGVWGNKQTLNNANKHSGGGGEMDITDQTDPFSRPQTQRNQPAASISSAWDKIRSENLPNNTWTKIRMEAQKNPESAVDVEKARSARLHRLRESSDFAGGSGEREIPRTREESLERGAPLRKNQWGDPLE
ncbi:hypothetical protein [Parasitella parasitica]|uniref:Uncharacterized protein n=1 Tax=Parasitella parasitica TaxID=35722 RepID=A0A0B7N6T1_9FUNG|nr:hypothetical protein [Parasitella parasitica]